MDTTQTLILALIQGLTEFLPISSSAHLILAPHLFGFTDQGLGFDISVHLGSLVAVALYFRRDLVLMARRTGPSQEPSLLPLVLLATLPIALVGGLLHGIVAHDLRSPLVIAAATIVFGLLLYFWDQKGKRHRDEHTLTAKDALIIGLFHVLAIIPGTSRSGITITAGLMLGLTREAASRFSFLLAIPTILLSGMVLATQWLDHPGQAQWDKLALGALLSFLVSYLTIHYFLRLVERMGMLPFMLYRLLLGSVILIIFWGSWG